MKRVFARTAMRYIAAFLLLLYGFAKINGSQFTVIQSVLDLPLRKVSGFWLVWYFFSFSRVYGLLIAYVQVVLAVGLLFQRTSLFAALGLLPVMINIILVDIFFSVPVSGLIAALVITALLLGILYPYIRPLVIYLYSISPTEGHHRISSYVLRCFIVAIPFLLTWYVAHYNNRRPTSIDGKWLVLKASPHLNMAPGLEYIYFERERAHMAVLRYPDTSYTCNFDIRNDLLTIRSTGPDTGTLCIGTMKKWNDCLLVSHTGDTLLVLKKQL